MVKSVLFGASNPDAFDGSMPLYDADGFFPGTIWSYQPGHPVYGGVPTNGGVAKNAAWRNAAKILGLSAASESTLHGTHTLGSDTGADRFKLELTPKGGLHTIISQTLGNNQTHWYATIPAAIRAYIFANSTVGGSSATDTGQVWNTPANHRFAQVAWITMTRAYRTDSGKVGNNLLISAISGAGNIAGIPGFGGLGSATNTPAYPITGSEDTGQSTAIGTLIGNSNWPSGVPTVGVPQMKWIATRGWFNAAPVDANAFMGIVGAGALPGQGAAGFQQAAMSYVLYRYDIIDLWHDNLYPYGQAFRGITGTDYSHLYGDIFGVRDQLRAAMNRAFAPGGAHYGDTLPTAPASIP
jgi:hypothetical protein